MKRIGYRTLKTKHTGKTDSRTLRDALPDIEEISACRTGLDWWFWDDIDECLPNAKEDCYRDWDWDGDYEYGINCLNDHYLSRNRTAG